MTNYLVAFIVACLLVIGFLIFVVKSQTAKIDGLIDDLAKAEAAYGQCTQINSQNTEEIAKINAASKKAKAESQASLDKAKAAEALYRKRLWEVLNAKDNGPIPGVVQRTLDGLRERTATYYQDRESPSLHSRGSTILHVPS